MADELTPERVRLAYQFFLGREPENDAAVRSAMTYGTVPRLRAAFFESPEFLGILGRLLKDQPPRANPRLVPIDAPPIEVEWQVDERTADELLAHVRTTWTRLGEERPHWSVLSAQPFTPEEIAKNEASFFASGSGDASALVGVLNRHAIRPADVRNVFEFGCGVGRVTAHLARAFPHVTACDVSTSHMAMARDVIARAGAQNVRFKLVEGAEFGMREPFDVWFTRIVLQHNPPPIIAMILRRALTMLEPGGVAVFQVPTYAVGYRFRVAEYLGGIAAAGGIEMHVLPQPVVFAICRESGCEPVEVLEDMSAGPSSSWSSTTFVVRKAGPGE